MTKNNDAYKYYLQGLDFLSKSTLRSTLDASIINFEHAITLDNEFANAYAQLCRAKVKLFNYKYSSSKTLIKQAEGTCYKAKNLSPNSVIVLLAIAQLNLETGKLESALNFIHLALSIDSDSVQGIISCIMICFYNLRTKLDPVLSLYIYLTMMFLMAIFIIKIIVM